MNIIEIVGIGPGDEQEMTAQALKALDESDVIIGYPVYLKLLGERFSDKEFMQTPMRHEIERCRMAFDEASAGKKVALIGSGDAGIYGLASLMYEMLPEYADNDISLHVVPGITAANSGAALLGAPINHDFCTISLSDALTPWSVIEKRLRAAAAGDFCIVLYNPASRKRPDYLQRACSILLDAGKPESTSCGLVRNIGREGTEKHVMTLSELSRTDADMFTTVYIGNSETYISGHDLVTPRGYKNM